MSERRRGQTPVEQKIERAHVVIGQLTAGTRQWDQNAELAIVEALVDAASDIETLLRQLDDERQMFPSEGVFEVHHGGGKSYMRIAKLGEIPDPIRFASVARHIGTIAEAIIQARDEQSQQHAGPGMRLIPSPYTEAEYVVRALERVGRP